MLQASGHSLQASVFPEAPGRKSVGRLDDSSFVLSQQRPYR